MAPALATDLGFSNDPAFDNTPAWNALAAAGPQWVHFQGDFTFKTKPNPVNRRVRYSGDFANKSVFYRDYVPGSQFEPFIEFTAQPYFEGFGIFAKQGAAGIAVSLKDTNHIDAAIVRDLYITSVVSGAMWAEAFRVDGPNALGARSITVHNVEMFACNAHIFRLISVIGGHFTNFNAYPAGGTVNHGVIDDGPGGRSQNIYMQTRYLEQMWVADSDNVKINRLHPITLHTPNSTNVTQF